MFWVFVCSVSYTVCKGHAPCVSHLWPIVLYRFFLHYFINITIYVDELLNIKYVFSFSLQIISEIFIILRRIPKGTTIYTCSSSCKVPIIPVRFYGNFSSVCRFSKNTQITNFLKILPVGVEFFHADKRKDWKNNEEADSRFLQFC
jgi:hypothetical protein